jgi:AcrR family transcriptional regulator
MAVSDATPLRADARRNLERILEAARAAFAERGLDVGVEEIARRAGVGKATFFRRFPTKDALVVAVFEGFHADLADCADRATALGDPWEGLRTFMIEHARMQADNAAFFDAVAARYHAGAIPDELLERGIATVDRVLEPARRAGLVREGVTAGDLTAMLKMLGVAVRPMPDIRMDEAAWMRYLELLLSGIRPGQDALPGEAMDVCVLSRQAAERSA